ncbi:B-cell receptor CD22-like [Xenopus laevis]|uniref:B-cell receptor CD22-like n=1 Tax=Xenopus laevis TaxID=8355 RepID=A0A8J1LDL2_XENLA|nr:B-cell receptor CD22-like [Xenopus laevis]
MALNVMNVFLFLQGAFTISESTDWKITIPRNLSTVIGACVEIPCKFSHPRLPNPLADIKLTWLQVKEDRVPREKIIFHMTNLRYNKRTSLIGNLDLKECSIGIKDLTKEDTASYKLKVEIEGYKNYTYASAFNLQVKDEPLIPYLEKSSSTIRAGDDVTFTCRINHTCPLRPPSWKWNINFGNIQNVQLALKEGMWQIVSTITFTANRKYQGQYITCMTSLKGGHKSKTVEAQLKIMYPPENTTVIVNDGPIREGQNLSLTCYSQSYPRVDHYAWYGKTQSGSALILPEKSSTLHIWSIKRNLTSFYCSARNSEGMQISLVRHLNVLYKPEIDPESKCIMNLDNMECCCRAQSNPPASIEWRLSDSRINQSRGGFVVHTTSSDHVTESTFKVAAPILSNIFCFSANEEGNAEIHLHPMSKEHSDLYKYMMAGFIGITVFGLVITGTVIASRYCRVNKGISDKDLKPVCKVQESKCVTDPESSSKPQFFKDYPQDRAKSKGFDPDCVQTIRKPEIFRTDVEQDCSLLERFYKDYPLNRSKEEEPYIDMTQKNRDQEEFYRDFPLHSSKPEELYTDIPQRIIEREVLYTNTAYRPGLPQSWTSQSNQAGSCHFVDTVIKNEPITEGPMMPIYDTVNPESQEPIIYQNMAEFIR